MTVLALLFALAAAPFWESKAPRDWTREELQEMLHDSPWARVATADGKVRAEGVQTYLAMPVHMQTAEEELRRRSRRGRENALLPEDYRDFLAESAGKVIVLAVRFTDLDPLSDAQEARRMEQECVMKVGRKRHKMEGHFPPTPSDPYLRLVFPRAVSAADKTIVFELYLPGVMSPYREVEYSVREMMFRGKPEF